MTGKKAINLGVCTAEEIKKADNIVAKIENETGYCSGIKDAFFRLGDKAIKNKIQW